MVCLCVQLNPAGGWWWCMCVCTFRGKHSFKISFHPLWLSAFIMCPGNSVCFCNSAVIYSPRYRPPPHQKNLMFWGEAPRTLRQMISQIPAGLTGPTSTVYINWAIRGVKQSSLLLLLSQNFRSSFSPSPPVPPVCTWARRQLQAQSWVSWAIQHVRLDLSLFCAPALIGWQFILLQCAAFPPLLAKDKREGPTSSAWQTSKIYESKHASFI